MKGETEENESRTLQLPNTRCQQFKGFSRTILTKRNLLADFTSIYQAT